MMTNSIYSQQADDTILDEMVISHEKLQTHHKSQRKIIIDDTLTRESTQSFTDFLLFNSFIYFKENGSGMVASPSFRGTTAQQTTVLWNGIRINSQFLGQTDFNAISYKEFNNIIIQPGGSSVISGSGAIGGTIHLNNGLVFKEQINGDLQLAYGSFNTYRFNSRFDTGSKKYQIQLNIHHHQSTNDFEVPYRNWKNTNGQFYNNSLNASMGYRFSRGNELSFHSNTYQDKRHFSLTSPNEIPGKYKNFTNRNLLQWKKANQNMNSLLKLVYLKEQYKYFENLQNENFTSGLINSYIIKYELDYSIQPKNKISAVVDYQSHSGSGKNTGIIKAHQQSGSAALLFSHLLNRHSGIEIGIRKEIAEDFESPFLYSAGAFLQFSEYYKLKSSLSKNFRIPTFNDLYWQPGGNLNLKPETSIQAEIGQEFSSKYLSVHHQLYYNKIADMIRWIPTSAGYWSAFNTDEVQILGTEVEVNSKLKWQKHYFDLSLGYTFNHSKDTSTNQFLVYSPKHRIIGTFQYRYEHWRFRLQSFYNGKVFTKADNDEETALLGYALANAFLSYDFGKRNQYKIALEMRNIFDTMYQNVESRPMPGRNYFVQFITQF